MAEVLNYIHFYTLTQTDYKDIFEFRLILAKILCIYSRHLDQSLEDTWTSASFPEDQMRIFSFDVFAFKHTLNVKK